MNDLTRERLDRVAKCIAEDQPVDWNVESDETELGNRRLANLRALERIGAVHRGRDESASTRPGLSPVGGPAVVRGGDGGTGSKWGPLELRELIGQGSAGSVFRAWDPDLQTEVALKLHGHHEDAPSDFLQEARRLAKVRHPNVVVVHGARERSERLGIWMELIRGNTLEDCLRNQGPYGSSEATSIGIDVLRALAAVHGAELVHRDIKASNVMREDGGRVVLMDFSSTVERRRLALLPDNEAFVGTARYMAPEIFAGQPGGATADLYSVGVLLYRLVTCEYPIDARTARELRDRHLAGEYVPLRDLRPDLPAHFVRVVEKALAPDVDDRYQTAGEMERDLAAEIAPIATITGRWRTLGAGAAVAAVIAVATVGLLQSCWAPLDVEAAFFRAFDQQEVRLQPGASLESGDDLFLEMRGTRKMWTYVFDEDDHGEVFVLFPLSGSDLENPLPANRTVRLPGTFDGEAKDWRVTSAGGREHLFVVVSTEPLEALEAEMAKVPEAASSGTPIPVGEETLRRARARGVGAVASRDEAPEDGKSSLSKMLQEMEDADEGLWTWSITLENPVR